MTNRSDPLTVRQPLDALLQRRVALVTDAASDEASFDRVFAVNVKSVYHMTRAVVPAIIEPRHSAILNIGSTPGCSRGQD